MSSAAFSGAAALSLPSPTRVYESALTVYGSHTSAPSSYTPAIRGYASGRLFAES